MHEHVPLGAILEGALRLWARLQSNTGALLQVLPLYVGDQLVPVTHNLATFVARKPFLHGDRLPSNCDRQSWLFLALLHCIWRLEGVTLKYDSSGL